MTYTLMRSHVLSKRRCGRTREIKSAHPTNMVDKLYAALQLHFVRVA